jgi:ElaB/YqjD/DUF883 family membrane-anchored ribosome-binding protein
MDRDPNNTYGTTGGSTSGSGSSGANPGFENTGAGYGTGTGSTGGANFGSAGVAGEYTETGTDSTRDIGERGRDFKENAKERLGHAREAASERLGQVREKAHDLKNKFADSLDAGADKLRGRGTGDGPSYATAEGMSAISTTEGTQSRVGDKVAGGMHNTAEWLRQNDLDSMKRGVEEQVRTNPGRSLLIAAVAGYLIGKALKR